MHASEKIDSLTSLRFFAAAMIVLGHSHRLFGSMELANTFSLAQGVSFFFVLSGFILAYNYPTLVSRGEIGAFFKARFARIWPAHIAAIFLMVWLTSDLNVGGLNRSQAVFAGLVNVLLLQSIVPFKDVFLAFNGVSWSISTEAFFYLAFPFLITSLLPGWKVKLLVLMGVVLAHLWFAWTWGISVDESSPQLNLMGLLYVNPIVRGLEFFIGILAFNLFSRWKASEHSANLSPRAFTFIECAVVITAVGSMWLSPRLTTFLGWSSGAATVMNYYLVKSGSAWAFALLILAFAFGKGRLSRYLGWGPMVLLGEISFALYLVHASVLKWYENNVTLFGTWPDSIKTTFFWLLSLLVAWLLHKIVENPCRKLILSKTRFEWIVAFKAMFGGRQSYYVLLMVLTMAGLQLTPRLVASGGCTQNGACESIVAKSVLPQAANFENYVTLLALHSRTSNDGARFLDLVFEVDRPMPVGHKLAVHMVAADGSIVVQSDFDLVRSRSLSKGDRWLEPIQIPDRFLGPQVVKLGLVIYADPRSPLHVRYPQTDYDGRRMLVDLAATGLKN